MADSDSGTSGSAANSKKVRSKKGRGKTNQKKSVSTDIDNQLTCLVCSEVFTDPADKLLECERCENWFCTNCLKMNDDVYKLMAERKDLHWFCSECEKPAISAVKSDKEIEEKCAAYMSSMTGKIEDIEEKLSHKADKSYVEDLDARIKCLESKGAEAAAPSVSGNKSETVRETIEEQRERQLRLKNIILQNLPESEKTETDDISKDDIQNVELVLGAIGVSEDNVIEKCVRLGKKDKDKTRIIKVTVSSVEMKRKILKSSKLLKDNDDYSDVFIGPDRTKMQRAEQFNLRKELRERRKNGETDIFIRNAKIVRAREKALQFKGGASSSEGAE